MGKKNKKGQQKSTELLPEKEKKGKPLKQSNSSMTNWLLLLLVVLPFLISSETMDPGITPRYVFLSLFILVFVLFFYGWKKTTATFSFPPILKAVFIFGLGFSLWSIISISSAANIPAGAYEIIRHLLNISLLFLIMQVISKEESQVLKICKALMIVALLQGLIGIIQYYGAGFTELPGANEKPYGMMANRNLFGSAQAFLLPFIIYVLYKASTFWKYISGIALTITIFSVILSQTRSAWLAAIVILVVSLVLVLIFAATERKKWLIGSLTSIIATALLTFLLLSSDTEGDLSQSIRSRAESFTGITTDTSSASSNISDRLKIWQKTIALIKDHPVTGVGPANWKINIASYGTEHMAWAKGNYIPDRVHNEYLQTTAETGIPGALLYFGMWLLIAITGMIIVIKTKDTDRRILIILMLSGLAAFATDSMFSFPTERIEHSLYIILMGGIILGCSLKQHSNTSEKSNQINKLWLGSLLLIAAVNLFMGIQKMNFEKHMYLVKAFENESKFADMLSEAESGLNGFVTLDPNAVPLESKIGAANSALKNYDQAIIAYNKAQKWNPNSPMIYNNLGTIYTELGQFDNAITAYEKALKLAPDYDIVLKNLAVNYFNKENYTACINALNKVDAAGDPYLIDLMNEAKRRLAAEKK